MVQTATVHDIPELVRLRSLLFDDLGGDFFKPPGAGDDWRAALARALERKLADPDCRILVVDGDDGLAGVARRGFIAVDRVFLADGLGEKALPARFHVHRITRQDMPDMTFVYHRSGLRCRFTRPGT